LFVHVASWLKTKKSFASIVEKLEAEVDRTDCPETAIDIYTYADADANADVDADDNVDADAEDNHASILAEAAEIALLLLRNTKELDAIVTALDGGYVALKPGGDLLRDESSVLLTGKNIHALDPGSSPIFPMEDRGAKTFVAPQLLMLAAAIEIIVSTTNPKPNPTTKSSSSEERHLRLLTGRPLYFTEEPFLLSASKISLLFALISFLLLPTLLSYLPALVWLGIGRMRLWVTTTVPFESDVND